MLKTVGVKFAGSQTIYSFLCDLDVKVSDRVVCDTTVGYSVGTVWKLTGDATKATRMIMQVVDVYGFEQRKVKLSQLAKVKAKMEARRKVWEDSQVWKALAAMDGEMNALYNEYQAILSS